MAKYIFTKNSSLEKPHNISKSAYDAAEYGTEFIYDPKDTPYKTYLLSGSALDIENKDYRQLRSLKNIINYYKAQDDMFNFDNYYDHPCALHCFYTSHIGSGFKPGTVQLNLYVSGSLLASATDSREDGVLYQEDNDEKIGIVLYKEGFILINNTSSLGNYNIPYSTPNISGYEPGNFIDNPRWIYAFTPNKYIADDISYGIYNDVATNLNFVYADKNKFNHSNNQTYIGNNNYKIITSSYYFIEDQKMEVANTIKPSFEGGTSINEKQTFITHIGLYNENKKLIAVGSLANPVRKTENREFAFKLKIDF